MSIKPLSREEIYKTAVSLARRLEANNDDRAKSGWLLEGRPWTDHIFSMLKNFCDTEPGLGSETSCYYHGHPDGKGEFLFDFTAFRGDTGMVIAGESEQYTYSQPQKESLMHDFEKLLYVYAPIRVLICKSKDQAVSSELIEELTQYGHRCCRSFNPGAVFLIHFRLWFWQNGSEKKSSYSYIWQSAGKPYETTEETLSFEPLLS